MPRTQGSRGPLSLRALTPPQPFSVQCCLLGFVTSDAGSDTGGSALWARRVYLVRWTDGKGVAQSGFQVAGWGWCAWGAFSFT